MKIVTKTKKGITYENAVLSIHTKQTAEEIRLDKEIGEWFVSFVTELKQSQKAMTFQQMKSKFEEDLNEDFEYFIYSKSAEKLKNVALLIV